MPKKVENVDKRRTPLDASNLALARVPALLAIRGGVSASLCACVCTSNRERERGLTTMLKASTGAGFKRLRPPQQSDRFAVYRGGCMTRLTPWPPSVNRYYRNVSGVTKISAEGRAYRAAVVNLLAEHARCRRWPGWWWVDIERTCRTARRRDLDNLLKGLLDALTHAGLWLDDSQVADLRIRRAPTIGGMVKVEVTPC